MNFTPIQWIPALTAVSAAITTNQTIEALEGVLIKQNGPNIDFIGSNLETTVTYQVPGTIHKTMCLPLPLLLNFMKALEPHEKFELRTEDDTAIFITSSGEQRMSGYDPATYPSIPEVEGEEQDVSAEDLKAVIKTVSSDALRMQLTGVHFDNRIESTDAHQLTSVSGYNFGGFIVPSRSINAVIRSMVTPMVKSDGDNAVFTEGKVIVTSSLIDGNFPDTTPILPVNPELSIKANRTELLEAVKRCLLFGSMTTYQVVLTPQEKGFTVSSENIDYGNGSNEEVQGACTITEPVTYNGKFLVDVLARLQCDEVEIKMEATNKASVVTEEVNGRDRLFLVMPIMMNR